MGWAYGWAGPVAWPGSIPHGRGASLVRARAPETKVTVCAQTVAARWAGCCWAPLDPSGWVGWLMWAEWVCGQWLQGWVVGVWLGWLAGWWSEKK
ncbi:uncharacterized protein MONOS_16380 [Monocercomonoides exilis]|uniref:uncharacterized protein n=1 Tax=Monocercomonoides exilis TaxID=2049356 RepID=UPI003559F2FC|nr:hypothetical protein MONOS_16380 [Monocercomonoides exilis]|eukprot:MONOS_16380.1-p1 / transcript=MONOS_16380.1 / gene=MONOS_16380 / organism=Monocercomonoides_exilis_PA203 / gene_product=unspecified product / transcript_product=unspecified product / location=Mono_scaffold01692:2314-2735(-) / protein_length=95 / sequence_SO=supercontig / SO=protein_coding / is_pseudo=false